MDSPKADPHAGRDLTHTQLFFAIELPDLLNLLNINGLAAGWEFTRLA